MVLNIRFDYEYRPRIDHSLSNSISFMFLTYSCIANATTPWPFYILFDVFWPYRSPIIFEGESQSKKKKKSHPGQQRSDTERWLMKNGRWE